ERARRLGELGLALHDLGLRFLVGTRQVAQDAAHFFESRPGRIGGMGVHSGRGPSYICLTMTSPSEPPIARPSSFDEWLQAFKEQATFFTGLKLDVGAPRWQLADVLPVLPFIGAGVGLAAGLVFAIMHGLGPGWLAAVVAVGSAVLLTRALHEDGL